MARRLPFLAVLAGYLLIALWFWDSHLVPGDSTSRVANAYYTLYSRDPHLAAIGFVWNPLPSLVLLPFLPLRHVFPALTQESLLPVLASAVFMAAVVWLVHDVLRRASVPPVPRALLTGAFALHPMIVVYAGNGMSEACFLLCLLLAVRHLQEWLTTARVTPLVPLGLAVGLAYGARYEALAPAAAVPVLVFLVTWWRTRSVATARVDAVIVAFPAALAVAVWALASRLIVGQWFATFSSEYGNSAQVSANSSGISSVTGTDLASRALYGGQQLLGLSPFVAVLLVAALILAWRRRSPGVLAPVTVLGSVLAFDALAFLSGTSFGWLRFHIAVIPLAVLLAGHCLSGQPAGAAATGATAGAPAHGASRWRAAAVRVRRHAAPLALAAAAIPAALVTLGTPELAREESEWFTASGAARTAALADVNATVAADLDRLALPDGAVVTDAAYAFGVILASDNPRQFVITPDRDFPATLAAPRESGARYLLISARGAADAVRRSTFGDAPVTAPGARSWHDPSGTVQWTLVPL
ncbi:MULTISPECIES: hypothetical protein [Catenuloplanes]|uniref:Glycosyltransferase RgtA/B/C/D-like domain-containing protein n=1 Tax=Catenuloplanes niger TaxID=587534 RepID=A0AAE3ZY54_9ACTN|nr:hypothetical protein [Catenuloplanes niger]MDR7328072.1 hypothetical protein [Catenuloplanes niger]